MSDTDILGSSSSSSSADYRLRVLSEPVGAAVFVNNEKLGQTPVEVPVPVETQKMRLTMEGYESYERQIPAAKDSEGDLVWKIQLKKETPKEKVEFYSREISPFSVQVKSVLLVDFSANKEDFPDINPKFCRVNIQGNNWVRVLLGPYSTKKKAQSQLVKIKKKYPDAFLSTKQDCLSDGEVK
ncbi:MAG: PEGA domain-containing protein [Bdellovibrionota bacterium]